MPSRPGDFQYMIMLFSCSNVQLYIFKIGKGKTITIFQIFRKCPQSVLQYNDDERLHFTRFFNIFFKAIYLVSEFISTPVLLVLLSTPSYFIVHQLSCFRRPFSWRAARKTAREDTEVCSLAGRFAALSCDSGAGENWNN